MIFNEGKKVLLSNLGIIAGLASVIAGGILLSQEMNNIAGVCISGGAVLFFLSIGYIINRMIERRNPDITRKKNIEVNDERNITIRNMAGAKVNSIIGWLVLVLILVFTLLDAELYIVLSMSGLILINTILYIVYFNYYNKRL